MGNEVAITKVIENEQSMTLRVRENGDKVFKTIPFVNYMYISTDDEELADYIIEQDCMEREYVTDALGRSLIKLYVNDNTKKYFTKMKLEKKGIKVYEGDISSIKRWLSLKPNINMNQHILKQSTFDIETFDLYGFDKDFKGKILPSYPILSYAMKTKEGKVYYCRNEGIDNAQFDDFKEIVTKLCDARFEYERIRAIPKYFETHSAEYEKYKEEYFSLKKQMEPMLPTVLKALTLGERQLLLQFIKDVDNIDLLLAWNGSGFDFPYVQGRMDFHNMDYKLLYMVDVDYQLVYKKNIYKELKSYKLQDVSMHEFQSEIDKEESKFKNLDEITKIDWKKKTKCQKYFELFLLEEEMFKEYNIQDCNLINLLEEKLKLMMVAAKETVLTHSFINEVTYNAPRSESLIFNEYVKRGIISNSKPSKEQVEEWKHPKTGLFTGGGYTYADLLGMHTYAIWFDFKSHYPLGGITYNISPETYVKSIYPNFEKIMSEEEIRLINYAEDIAFSFMNAKGEVNKKKYAKAIQEKSDDLGVKKTMEELMFVIVEDYKLTELTAYLKENNYTATPCDLHLSKRGWKIHPHYVFDNKQEGVLPYIWKKLITTRDKIKYELKNLDKDSFEYLAKWTDQQAMKIAANGLFGYTAYKPNRYFMIEIADAITTSCRAATKATIKYNERLGWININGDTDSTDIKYKEDIPAEELTVKIRELEILYYKFFEEFVKPYNTQARDIYMINPEVEDKLKIAIKDRDERLAIANEDGCGGAIGDYQDMADYVEELEGKLKEKKNYFIVFEYEKMFHRCIVTAKKRYYYKSWDKKSEKFRYGCVGGAYIKSDTVEIAAKMQKELCKDILDETYLRVNWKLKIMKLKEEVFAGKLDKKYIIKTVGINKPFDEYGKPMIDGNTGLPKKRKDGEIRHAPIPAGVKLAMEEMKRGYEYNVGDKISFIVKSDGPIVPISLDDFANGEMYDCHYYWLKIITPLIEILHVIDGKETYKYFADCWDFTERKLKNLLEKLED